MTLSFNLGMTTQEENRLLAFIDSLFSVAILEKTSITLQDYSKNNTFRYLSEPYQQFCKENLSWIERYLHILKAGKQGLPFQLKELTENPKHAELLNIA